MSLIYVDAYAILVAMRKGQTVIGIYPDGGSVVFPADAIVETEYVTFDGIHEEQFASIVICELVVTPVY